MADEFEQAQNLEEAERAFAIAQHQHRNRTEPRDDCADCGEDLELHRKPYGTCIYCQTARETRARLHQR